MSINTPKLRHQSGAVLLSGCLLISAAHAQTVPPIQAAPGEAGAATAPATDATVTGATATESAPVPKRVAPLATRPATLELSFRDIAVKDLLNQVGPAFNINIVVNDDIEGRISSLNLTNQTPEEALQAIVAGARNLVVTRMTNGTYIARKADPGETPGFFTGAAQTTAPSFVGANNLNSTAFSRPITPTGSNGFDSATFTGAPTGDVLQNMRLGGALPPLGQASDLNIPDLAPLGSSRGAGSASRYIRLKNVKPSVMAYWLDPAHNALPQALQNSKGNENSYGRTPLASAATESGLGIEGSFNGFGALPSGTTSPYVNPYTPRTNASSRVSPTVRSNSQFGGGGFGGQNNQQGGQQGGAQGGAQGTFELPGDIQQLVSVDPQNVLLVAGGSDEDVRTLQTLIDVLDQPLRQVEIEAQFIDLTTDDARTFGIDFSTSRGNIDAATTGLAAAPVPGSITVGFVRGNFQARLSALIANRRAKIITAPRVTAINNLTASLESVQRRPLILTSVSQNIGGQQAQQQQLLFISTTVGLTVTPTINGDDTITVLMQPEVSTQDGSTGLGNITQRRINTIANVRDGDTIVLGGLKQLTASRQNFRIPLLSDIPLIGGLFRSRNVSETQTELIVFLTARIVRRAGDDNLVAGT